MRCPWYSLEELNQVPIKCPWYSFEDIDNVVNMHAQIAGLVMTFAYLKKLFFPLIVNMPNIWEDSLK